MSSHRHDEPIPALDRLIPAPRLVEVDRVDVPASPAEVWALVRHGALGHSPLVRALFAVRTLGRAEPSLRIDDLVSSPERPGFQLLVDDPPSELAVAAIGRVWKRDIPFVHVPTAADFAAFDQPGFARVAWGIRLAPHLAGTRVELEVRVDTTDEASWRRFRRYFRLIGIGSRLIRRMVLADVARQFGKLPDEEGRQLAGDELLPDAALQLTHSIEIAAAPEAIWPWLVQMGCGRAGFYSYDSLDNGNERSAREIHSELQALSVGDVLPATPGGEDGFEVLRLEPPRALVLGGLFDLQAGHQLPFGGKRPGEYSHVTWAFALEPLGARSTRLAVRARAAWHPDHRAIGIRAVHHFMESEQLRQLAARAEGRLPRDDWRDVAAGVGGAALMAAALLAPFLRESRSHWGVDEQAARRPHPGDDLVPAPRWSWTHGVEIDAPAEGVWPWVAQIGADRGGFYSYQWLENLAGCEVRNAETVHPEWEVREGDRLVLHPGKAVLPVVACERGRWFVAHAAADESARAAGRPWVTASWLFEVEPLGADRCRVISRYRADCSDGLASRLRFGPALVEPVGFAMDRRMLLGIKERAERVAATFAG